MEFRTSNSQSVPTERDTHIHLTDVPIKMLISSGKKIDIVPGFNRDI